MGPGVMAMKRCVLSTLQSSTTVASVPDAVYSHIQKHPLFGGSFILVQRIQSAYSKLRSEPALGGAEPNAEHMYCNVLFCVLDEPRVDYTPVWGPN